MEITLKTLHNDMQNLNGKVNNLEGEVQNLKGAVHNVQDSIAEVKTNTIRWMVGLFIGGVALFATIVGVYTGAVLIAMGG